MLGIAKNAAYYHINKLKHGKKRNDKYSKERRKYTIQWSAYNEGLVKRGEILFEIDTNALNSSSELRTLNGNKVGRRFVYTGTLIVMLTVMKVRFRLDYRTLEGIARKILPLLGAEVKAPEGSK